MDKTRADFDRIGFNIPRWQLLGAAEGYTHAERVVGWLEGCP
jgi:hypothetical protein